MNRNGNRSRYPYSYSYWRLPIPIPYSRSLFLFPIPIPHPDSQSLSLLRPYFGPYFPFVGCPIFPHFYALIPIKIAYGSGCLSKEELMNGWENSEAFRAAMNGLDHRAYPTPLANLFFICCSGGRESYFFSRQVSIEVMRRY